MILGQIPWSVPFEVVKKFSDLLYRVNFTNKVKVIHHDRLKSCYGNVQVQNQNSKVEDNLSGEIVNQTTLMITQLREMTLGMCPQGFLL